jgi:hypothetical protein
MPIFLTFQEQKDKTILLEYFLGKHIKKESIKVTPKQQLKININVYEIYKKKIPKVVFINSFSRKNCMIYVQLSYMCCI